MPGQQPLEVFQLSTLAEFASLHSRWNELAGNVPTRRWEWLEGWWRAYGNTSGSHSHGGDAAPDKELYLLAVFEAPDRLVAIAPWYIQHSVNYGRTLRFLGSGEVCTDDSTVLCQPGYERAVAEAIARSLSDPLHVAEWLTQNSVRHWDRIEFDAIDASDRMMQVLLAELERHENLVHRRSTANCWRVALPKTWDDYLAVLSKSHRKQLRRCQRDYFDTGRAVFREAISDDQLAFAWKLLVRLHERRQQSQGKRGSFASPRYTEFHQSIAADLRRAGAARLRWLEVDGVPLAAEYHLIGGKTVYAYQGGIDPDRLDLSPGQMILCASLQSAIAEGYESFDFLRGNEPYKAHWRATPRSVENVRVIRRTASNRVRHGLWVASDHLRHWLKSSFGASAAAF